MSYDWQAREPSEECGKAPDLREAIIVARGMLLETHIPTQRQREMAIEAFNVFLNGGVRK